MNAIKWLTDRGLKVCSVKQLDGLTGSSHLIELADGKKLVWRQPSQTAYDYGVNYQQEAELLRKLAFLPFVPKCYAVHSAFSLLHWLEGDVPGAFNDWRLQQLAEKLATLHTIDLQALGLVPHIAKLDVAERCCFLWERLTPSARATLDFTPPFHTIAPFGQAICHHDIHLGNLVEQAGGLFLIDWEYAALSDPALEIALFLNANTLTAAQQALFFRHYFAKYPADRCAFLAKVAEYQPLVYRLNQLWFALHRQLSDGNTECKFM